MSFKIPGKIKKIIKPLAKAVASAMVWILLLIHYYVFRRNKNYLPVLFVNLCLNDLLVFKIDPKKIKYHTGDPDKLSDNLFVWSGGWDRKIIVIEEHEKFNMIRELIVEKRKYEELQFYSYAIKQIKMGKPVSRGNQMLDSKEKIMQYFKKQERLFEEIRSRGFNLELAPEIGVAVSREGGLIHYRQGHHTLAMAKILGVKNVRVRTRAVHRLWLLENIKGDGLFLLKSLRRGINKLYKQA
ncbi:hypothetical protein ACFLQQ_01295 [Actinomycetota bacterium]